jgi:soluble lytic murein transglycosylase
LLGALLALVATASVARPPKAARSAAPAPAAVISTALVDTASSNGTSQTAAGSSVAAAAAAQADRDFLLARDAYKAGDGIKLDRLAVSLESHLLAPYVRYWQLRLRIDEVDPVTVRSFIAMHRDSLLAERMRSDWLKALGKRGAWELFAQEYPLVQEEDVELTCYGLQQRFSTQPAEVMAEAKRLWLTGADTPDSCEPLFGAMLDKGVMNERDLWMRFELAAEAANFSLAQRLNARLPNGHQIGAKDLERANRDPERLLAKVEFHGATVAGRELALYGLHRAISRTGRGGLEAVVEVWKRARGQLPRRYAEVGNGALA